MSIPIQSLISIAADLCGDAAIDDPENEYMRGQVELIRDIAGGQIDPNMELDADEVRGIIGQAIADRAAATRLGKNYPPYQDGDMLASGRQHPVTEEQWKLEHAKYDCDEQYELAPRPVIVMWHDPTETPTEAIIRLNGEVARFAERTSF